MDAPRHAVRRPAGRSLSARDYRALAELRFRIRSFLAFSTQAAREHGLEPQQHQLLLAVKGLSPGELPTIRVLSERLLLKHHTVVGLLNRLVDRGLAVRRQSPRDRREILIQITPYAERLLRSLSVAHRDELNSVAGSLFEALSDFVRKPKRARRRARSRSGRPQ